MKSHILYSELLDMFLVLRQCFSRERFYPFNDYMKSFQSKLSEHQLETIQTFGILSNGYLSAISALIDIKLENMESDDSLIVDLLDNPALLFISSYDQINDEQVISKYDQLLKKYHLNNKIKDSMRSDLSVIWTDMVCREKANHSRKIYDKLKELKTSINDKAILQYLESLSDRFYLDDKHIHFRIKPALKLEIDSIENVIVMPSIYAGRDLTFWHSGNNLLFFTSIETENDQSFEPSDMLLLYTSALNDKTRLKMLKFLSRGNCSAGELADFLQMNASTVSRHLKIFKDAGLVDLYSNDGKKIIYTINPSGLNVAFERLQTFILNREN